MTYLKKNSLAAVSALLCLMVPVTGKAANSPAMRSSPAVRVLLYAFPGVSTPALRDAEAEAARILQPVRIELNWIDCTAPVSPAACMPPTIESDLIIRLLPKALPQATTRALGIAGSSGDYAIAFLFYDRILALRTHTRPLPAMLGRVLAHEITHLLLPREGHAEFGLMRADWNMDDLRFNSSACFGLPAKSIQLVQGEAVRRAMAASGAVGR